MKRIIALVLALALLLPMCAAAEGLQDCHRVKAAYADTKQANKSVVRLWTVDTALDSVDQELKALAEEYVDRLAPELPQASNSTSKNSRLEVEIRYSRTGLEWMSFLVQARTTYHRKLTAQEFTSRTYNMVTGDRILLTDIFPEGSEGWTLLRNAVQETVTAYFPDETPDAAALAETVSDEGLRKMDFTLHGMSLVVHLPAGRFYEGKNTLIEVTLFYPQIRAHMTEKAQIETDNLSYYKTVALTFDDGPDRINTTKVLNSMLEVGGRATFFMPGNRVGGYKDLVQRAHDEGHAIGSHNYTHGDVSKMSPAAIRGQKAKINKAFAPIIGINPRYNRVPYGLYPDMIDAKAGWPLIQWSVDTYDWRGRSTSAIMNNIKKQFTDGDIVLMHDVKEKTPVTAKTLANWLKENGYMLLTVDELFAKDGVVLAEDVVYFRCDDGVTTIKDR